MDTLVGGDGIVERDAQLGEALHVFGYGVELLVEGICLLGFPAEVIGVH